LDQAAEDVTYLKGRCEELEKIKRSAVHQEWFFPLDLTRWKFKISEEAAA
jgi:hypothetical protein